MAVHVLHEGGALQRVLEDLDQRAVAGEEGRRRAALLPPADAEALLERGGVGDLEADQRLPGPGDAGDEDEVAAPLLSRLVEERDDLRDGRMDAGALGAFAVFIAGLCSRNMNMLE